MIKLERKIFWSKKLFYGKMNDTSININQDDMGGPSLQSRFGYSATIFVGGERMIISRQFEERYLAQYLEKVFECIGNRLRIKKCG